MKAEMTKKEIEETKIIETKQVVRVSKSKRRQGFYLVKDDGKLIGSITKAYHVNDIFHGHSDITGRREMLSTKDLAESFVIQEALNLNE